MPSLVEEGAPFSGAREVFWGGEEGRPQPDDGEMAMFFYLYDR